MNHTKRKKLSDYQRADIRARGLAKKILGSDFDRLMKKGYLTFKINVKQSSLGLTKFIIGKDIAVYRYDKKKNRYFRYCSLIQERPAWQYEQNVYPRTLDNHYSKYDKLVAYYLWLKNYSKNGVSKFQFKKQFNFIDDPQSIYDLHVEWGLRKFKPKYRNNE